MRVLSIIVFCLLSFSSLVSAQFDQKIGEWKSYLPYNDGRWVTQSPEKIYYCTDEALFSIDKEDVTDVMFKSKVEGLTGVGIKRIQYDNYTDQLIIAYNDSNIDILANDNIINISDIKDNQVLTGDRSINDIHILKENIVFFATAFGIVELNLEKEEFSSTVFTNIAVTDITSKGDLLYAATADGIYYINTSTSANISDFSSWSILDDNQGLPVVYDAQFLEVFDDKLYAVLDDELWFENEAGIFQQLIIEGFEDLTMHSLSLGNDRLLLGMRNNNNGRVIYIQKDNSFKSGLSGCVSRILYAIEDEKGRIWYADEYAEIRWSDSDGGGCHKDLNNTPFSQEATDIDVNDGKIYIASGGVKDNYTPLFNRDGFYIYDNGNWTQYTKRNIPELDDKDFLNNFQIETHPNDERVFIASYYEGLLEYNPETGESLVFNTHNSPITNTEGDSQRERISGLAFDDNDVLWVNNFGASTPLLAYTPEGNWHAFNPIGDNQIAKVVVDNSGYTWSVLTTAAGGVIVHDSNNTLEDPSDDRSVLINSSNSAIETGQVNTVAVDLDGEIWVGTNKGPVIFDSSPSLFEGGNDFGSVRQVLQDSIPALLLETEDILAIEFDGANRKWFGTRNGIFVQSPDGETQELRFNVDNSPLFDNIISTLKYDPQTGIMYIATNKGVQSYKTQTLGSKKRHSNVVYAYPNPVRPEYNGPIAIKGLARDANVKITDLNGKLVYETTALGGQAIWDGKDYNGRKASTGVYYVFSTGAVTFDTPDSFVTKIMIVN